MIKANMTATVNVKTLIFTIKIVSIDFRDDG